MSDVEAVDQLNAIRDQIYAEVGKVVIGQKQVVEELLIALLSGGHCLLVGVPGLAKTTLIQTLAHTLDLSFGRIQFTPDLALRHHWHRRAEEDADGRKAFRFTKGLLFAHVSPTRSPHSPKPRPRYCRQCKSTPSLPAARPCTSTSPSSCSPPRTPSSKKFTPSPKPAIALSSNYGSTTPTRVRKKTSSCHHQCGQGRSAKSHRCRATVALQQPARRAGGRPRSICCRVIHACGLK